jgi:hypothetical protein
MLQDRDDLFTLTSIGILAYLIADLAHHLLGHGGACLVEHGRMLLLSSIVLKCSAQSLFIDLSGPLGNVVAGLLALWVATSMARGATKLLASLAAAFNLFWFAGQMLVSVATRTDDWAWAMHDYHLSQIAQALLMGVAVLLYLGVVRTVAAVLAGFASPRERLARICRVAWLAAASVAALSALLDTSPVAALLRHALPQGLLSPLGLLLIPRRAMRQEGIVPESSVPRSWPWMATGVLGALLSVGLLGPGLGF